MQTTSPLRPSLLTWRSLSPLGWTSTVLWPLSWPFSSPGSPSQRRRASGRGQSFPPSAPTPSFTTVTPTHVRRRPTHASPTLPPITP